MDFILTYFNRKWVLYGYLIFVIICFISIYHLNSINAAPILIILIIFFLILIISFSKKIINKWFLKNIQLTISSSCISIKKINKYGEQESLIITQFKDIRKYEINLVGGSSDFYELQLYFFSGKNSTYTFPVTDSNFLILKTLYTSIEDYSKNNFSDNNNKLNSGFLSTNKGLIVIKIYAIITFLIIVLHILLDTKTSFASILISISILFQLIGTRKQQIILIEKLKKE